MSEQGSAEDVTGTTDAVAGAVATAGHAPGGLGGTVGPNTPDALADADPEATGPTSPTWPQLPGEDAGRHRRRRLIVGGAVLAGLVLLAAAGFAVKNAATGHAAYRYVPPQQFKGLQTSPDAPPSSTPHADFSIYGTPADGTVMVMANLSPTTDPSAELDDTLRQESAHLDARLRTARRVDAGPRGGVMACTAQPLDSIPGLPGLPGGVCVWADRSMTVTFLEQTNGPESPLDLDQLASDARAFRLLCEQPT